MGISFKKFSRMTPGQLDKYRARVIALHRGLLLVHAIGLGSVCLFALGLVGYHLLTK